MFLSQRVLGFFYIDKIFIELRTFQLMSRFITYHSYSKIGKVMAILGKKKTTGVFNSNFEKTGRRAGVQAANLLEVVNSHSL